MKSTSNIDFYHKAVRKALCAFASFSEGNQCAQVVCVMSGPLSLAQETRQALLKAFGALGYADEDFFVLSVAPGASGQSAADEDVRLCIETVNPLVVVMLDAFSASAVAKAYGLPNFVPGSRTEKTGRSFVALDDFETALSDESAKRIAWNQLKAARRTVAVM